MKKNRQVCALCVLFAPPLPVTFTLPLTVTRALLALALPLAGSFPITFTPPFPPSSFPWLGLAFSCFTLPLALPLVPASAPLHFPPPYPYP